MDRRLAEQRVAVDFIVRNRRADLRPAGCPGRVRRARKRNAGDDAVVAKPELVAPRAAIAIVEGTDDPVDGTAKRRSEEQTSELQSLMRISYAGFCLKKKTQTEN